MTGALLRVGPLRLALIPSRREARVTIRAWAQRGNRRRGAWMVARLSPMRIAVGREATDAA